MIPANKAIGEIVNINDVRKTTSNYLYWIIPCSEGDNLTITTEGNGVNVRALVFLDAENVVLYATAPQTTMLDHYLFVAPTGTAKALVQSTGSYTQYFGEYTSIQNKLTALQSADADIFTKLTKIDNTLVITSPNTVPYIFTVDETYEITNNSDVAVSFRTRLSPSSANVETISINSGVTKQFTCTLPADGINIYISDGAINVTINQMNTLEQMANDSRDWIATNSQRVTAIEDNIVHKVIINSSGNTVYTFESGHAYKIVNNSSAPISVRTRKTNASTTLEQISLNSGVTKYFECTIDADIANIYISSDNTVSVTIEDAGSIEYRIETNSERLSALESDGVPSYFRAMMDAKLPIIRANLNEVGQNGDSFIFITDIHWENNAKRSPGLIKYIINNTNINKVLCGGDIISQGTAEKMMNDMNSAIKGLEFPFHNDLLIAFGNHDSNKMAQNPSSEHFDLNTCYALMEKEAESYITMMTDYDLSFYYDNQANKTRYIVLDMGEDSGSSGRVFTAYQEFANTLLATPENWKIIVVGHIVTYGRFTYIGAMMDAYNAKSTYSRDGVGSFDFADAKGHIVCAFGGHTHIDSINATSGDIPIIVTGTDSNRVGDNPEYPYVLGTDQEQSFDVVTINYTSKTIKCVRIGRGVDRTVTFN